MSNTERQRRFCERHPGYYQRLHARRRAATKTRVEAMVAAQAATPTTAQSLGLPAPLAITIPTFRLALPAPAETIEILGMTTIAPPRDAAMQPLSPAATTAAERSLAA